MFMMLITLIIFSNLLSLFISNWFILWILMEINLLSFIPILMNKINIKNSCIYTFKYFFIQSFSSMIFILSLLMNMMSFNKTMMMMSMSIFFFTLIMKLGMFPFHFWYILMMKNLNWLNCFLISSIQKLIPIFLLINMMIKISKMMLLMNLINLMIGIMNGVNQNNLKLLLGYSSMNHLSWMILIIFLKEKIFFMYFLIYLMINMNIMFMLNMMNINFMNEIYNFSLNKIQKMILMMNFISLAGIPPMMGFMIKWISLNLMKLNFNLMFYFSLFMILSTSNLFFYMYIMIPSFMLFNKMNKLNNVNLMLNNNWMIFILLNIINMFILLFNNMFF